MFEGKTASISYAARSITKQYCAASKLKLSYTESWHTQELYRMASAIGRRIYLRRVKHTACGLVMLVPQEWANMVWKNTALGDNEKACQPVFTLTKGILR